MHDRLILAVADELEALARRVEAIGACAAGDPTFAARNMLLLQEVDLVSQTQVELARVLKALFDHGPSRAVDGVRLETLAKRLAS